MRANKRALIALSAGIGIPFGNHNRNAAFLISGSALLERTVCVIHKCGNRQCVAVHKAYGLHYIVNHFDKLSRTLFLNGSSVIHSVCPVSRNVYLNVSGSACVDSLFVHFNYLFALLHKLLGFFFHIADSLSFGKNL